MTKINGKLWNISVIAGILKFIPCVGILRILTEIEKFVSWEIYRKDLTQTALGNFLLWERLWRVFHQNARSNKKIRSFYEKFIEIKWNVPELFYEWPFSIMPVIIWRGRFLDWMPTKLQFIPHETVQTSLVVRISLKLIILIITYDS